MHIVRRKTTNGQQRLVQNALANHFAIKFDEDASLFHRALRCLGLWLPACRWQHHPGRRFLEGRAQDRFLTGPLSTVAVLLGEKTSEDAALPLEVFVGAALHNHALL